MKVHIRTPWYGAFDKFHDWEKGDFGVGVAEFRIRRAIRDKEKLEITVGKDDRVHVLAPQTFLKRAKYHKGHYLAHAGGRAIKILVVPISYLRRFVKRKEKNGI